MKKNLLMVERGCRSRAWPGRAEFEGVVRQPVHAPMLHLAVNDEVQPILEARSELAAVGLVLCIDLEVGKLQRLHPREVAEGNPLRPVLHDGLEDQQNMGGLDLGPHDYRNYCCNYQY